MRIRLAMIALAVCFATPALAHGHHPRHRVGHSRVHNPPSDWGNAWGWPETVEQSISRAFSDGRPAAWCGWEMRRLVGSDPGPAYNLARNWAHWGRSGPAGIGAVVVWNHHVAKIVGQQNGVWVMESGNDGHALRTRPRSIAGAIAIRWGA